MPSARATARAVGARARAGRRLRFGCSARRRRSPRRELQRLGRAAEDAILALRSGVDTGLLVDQVADWLDTRASVVSPAAARLDTACRRHGVRFRPAALRRVLRPLPRVTSTGCREKSAGSCTPGRFPGGFAAAIVPATSAYRSGSRLPRLRRPGRRRRPSWSARYPRYAAGRMFGRLVDDQRSRIARYAGRPFRRWCKHTVATDAQGRDRLPSSLRRLSCMSRLSACIRAAVRSPRRPYLRSPSSVGSRA